MATRVLIAYGSKYGSTAEIAEKLGETLRKEGLLADVMPAGKARDLPGYQAFVIGSAAYIGGWRKEVVDFLRSNEKLLSEQPVWIFSSGPASKGDPVELVQGWRYPKSLAPVIERIKPRDATVFQGLINASRMNFIEKWMMNRTKTPIGDFRDWDAIARWAAGIAAVLKKK
jgi:menaquinone-dependent protoporphyrinogen oxidase